MAFRRYKSRMLRLVATHGPSVYAFAKELGVKQSTVTDWTARRYPNGESLALIARKTGVSLDWLLGLRGTDGAIVYHSQAAEPGDLPTQLRAHVRAALVASGRQTRMVENFLPTGEEVLAAVLQQSAHQVDLLAGASRRRWLQEVKEIIPPETPHGQVAALERAVEEHSNTAKPMPETEDRTSLIWSTVNRLHEHLREYQQREATTEHRNAWGPTFPSTPPVSMSPSPDVSRGNPTPSEFPPPASFQAPLAGNSSKPDVLRRTRT